MNYEPFLDKEAIEKLKIEELSSDKQQKEHQNRLKLSIVVAKIF